MKRLRITKKIINKQVELDELVKRKQSLQDREVYAKSCELDKLVVEYMRICK
ncbi:MAG: Spo0E family sporulation regulatory protein-aspartic acid phosphatase [Bacillota bacterium]